MYGPAGDDLVQALLERGSATAGDLAFTFTSGGADEEDTEESLTFGDLLARSQGVAAALDGLCTPGSRVLVLTEPGLDFVPAFFGALLAGAIPVPTYPPDPTRAQTTGERLQSIVMDCEPRAVLTTRLLDGFKDQIVAWTPALAAVPWIPVDAVAPVHGPPPRGAAPVHGLHPGRPAFLQYTSGSTAAPRGVVVSHRNVFANVDDMRSWPRVGEAPILGSWLPQFHDMGLIGIVLSAVVLGLPAHLMSPADFIERPARWLRLISRKRITASGAPDFGYGLCLRRVTDEDIAGIDLSCWTVAFNGSEPVRAGTIERFAERFAPYGLKLESLFPCYGLAEATVFVSGAVNGPIVRRFAAEPLAHGHARPVAPRGEGRDLVSSGPPAASQDVVIVDPGRRVRLPAGQIGEIWVSGPNVAAGYWNERAPADGPFHGELAGGARSGRYLRTGDLGFLLDGELFVCGRRKDLIVYAGQNIYPQDVELAAERAHEDVRPGRVVAYGGDGPDGEMITVVAELRPAGLPRAEEVIRNIRMRVQREHRIPLARVCLVPPGAVPKTTSGKIQRRACRARCEAGLLEPVAEWSRAR